MTKSLLEETIAKIGPLDETAQSRARARQDRLTKPQGSLGRLEDLGVQVAAITGQIRPVIEEKLAFTFCGDHGVVAEGVSAYPAEVTPQMVFNFSAGGAAISALSRWAGAKTVVVDIGVAAPLDNCDNILHRKVRTGTDNIAHGPAMSAGEAVAALETGIRVFQERWGGRPALVALGEMGIANTTSASAITSVMTARPPAEVTGRGTGVVDDRLAHKIKIVQQALEVNRPNPKDGLDVLAKVGGMEIGGMAGTMLAAAASRVPIIIDGFICGAAALIADALQPRCRDYMIAGHCSMEPGHRILLSHLNLTPILDLNMRLGEGSGAVLAMPIVEAACRILAEMATFEDAGVSEKL